MLSSARCASEVYLAISIARTEGVRVNFRGTWSSDAGAREICCEALARQPPTGRGMSATQARSLRGLQRRWSHAQAPVRWWRASSASVSMPGMLVKERGRGRQMRSRTYKSKKTRRVRQGLQRTRGWKAIVTLDPSQILSVPAANFLPFTPFPFIQHISYHCAANLSSTKNRTQVLVI